MDNLATRASLLLRRARRRYLMLKARATGRAFFCEALAGNSQINISINSDLTVSCNCHDVDGSGHIGDLNRQSLADCFAGPQATAFRKCLAHGRLPIANCARCCDLRIVSREAALKGIDHYHLPDFVMVENTSACNLQCVSCPRRSIRRLRRKPFLSLDDVRVVADQLYQAGVRKVAYLNLGEPFLSPNLRQELEIIRRRNPDITIHTSSNGVLIHSDRKREAALLFDQMQISLDGVSNPMVNKYQRGSDFERAYQNMADLVAYRDARGGQRPRIVWKYLLFRWNEARRHVEKAIAMARQAHVDEILFERTVSPFYGIPLRSYLGLHRRVGQDAGGDRLVVLRPTG